MAGGGIWERETYQILGPNEVIQIPYTAAIPMLHQDCYTRSFCKFLKHN